MKKYEISTIWHMSYLFHTFCILVSYFAGRYGSYLFRTFNYLAKPLVSVTRASYNAQFWVSEWVPDPCPRYYYALNLYSVHDSRGSLP